MSRTEPNPSENPFASPMDSGQKLATIVPVRRDGEQLAELATLVSDGLLYRKIQVHAPVEATIEYVGRGLRDRILVNNAQVFWRLPIMGLSGVFEFDIQTQAGPLPAKIIIDVGRMLHLLRFEIIINDQTVYLEKKEREL